MNKDLSELIGTLVGYTIGVLVANGIIMWVYNMVVPDVFGLKPIGYWQLFGLYMVCHYLFKPHSYKTKKDWAVKNSCILHLWKFVGIIGWYTVCFIGYGLPFSRIIRRWLRARSNTWLYGLKPTITKFTTIVWVNLIDFLKKAGKLKE